MLAAVMPVRLLSSIFGSSAVLGEHVSGVLEALGMPRTLTRAPTLTRIPTLTFTPFGTLARAPALTPTLSRPRTRRWACSSSP